MYYTKIGCNQGAADEAGVRICIYVYTMMMSSHRRTGEYTYVNGTPEAMYAKN